MTDGGVYTKEGKIIALVIHRDVWSMKGECLGKLARGRYISRDMGLVGSEIPPTKKPYELPKPPETIEVENLQPDIDSDLSRACYEDVLSYFAKS